jgi:methyl-accepting chemotaxis protein
MRFLNNLTVRGKLGAAFGAVLLLMLLLGAAAVWQMSRMHDQTEQIVTYRVAGVRDAGRMVATATRFRTREYRLAAVPADEVDKALQSYERGLAEFEKAEHDYAAMILDDKERALYDAAKAAWAPYREQSQRIVAAAKAGDGAKAMQLVMDGSKRFDGVMAALGAIVQYNDDGAKADSQVAARLYRNGGITIAITVAFTAAAAMGLGLAIARAITRPLDRAVAVARAVAEGDLTQRIEADTRDEIGQLSRALGEMVERLRGIVGDVRSSVESVSTASSQIAVGNADLSQRTEEQASNLQQTAASMEQLTSTVRQNADNARAASQLAGSARDVAARGGAVVGEVVDTMGRITAGSRKIADIIAVIDGIAFQTNILALNAAVEAARAGDQGRGFAVVAGEVRALAQRSAAAAKEIKTLIEQSVESVESGSALVAEAGKTMAEIVSQVQRVNDLVGEISAASAEQSQGIGQVGDAVAQLDQVTQQNAALVEESAAAADSLKQQAQRLAEVVQVFRVDGAAERSPAAAGVAATGASARVVAGPRASSVARSPAATVAATAGAAARPGSTSDAAWASF